MKNYYDSQPEKDLDEWAEAAGLKKCPKCDGAMRLRHATVMGIESPVLNSKNVFECEKCFFTEIRG